uniref:uncharacterized protein LOC122590605 n=1 Tax=Erigeron canadensis TaxID=72917 RepID=UPI001CB8B3DB|nr:uncharacterized protein LOC122590605 [Erigeron canadensis]
MGFPLLFALEKRKSCLVAERVGFEGRWDWYRRPRSEAEIKEWRRLCRLLDEVSLNSNTDSWKWRGDEKHGFSVKGMGKLLIKEKDFSDRFIFKWVRWVPKKCNIFVWRAVMDRVPTMVSLQARNCFTGDVNCGMCNMGPESIDHLLCHCHIAIEVWNAVSSWCHTAPIFFFDVKDIVDIHKHVGAGREKRKILKGIVWTTCWCIWKARNDRRFNEIETNPVEIIHNIKSLGFLWFKNRLCFARTL